MIGLHPGLQMNLADSERMAGTLESAGYTCAADASDADVIVYNTCSIRDKVQALCDHLTL